MYAVTAEQSAPTSACPRTPLPGAAEELRQLEDRGGADDRRREQEGEPRRVLVREADEQPAAHRRARAREARDEGKRLRRADEDRVAPARPAARSGCRRPRRSAARAAAAARRRRAATRSASGRSPPTARRRRCFGACPGAAARGSRPGSCPTTSSQPSFASASSGSMPRSRSDRPSPLTIRTQSRQKNPSRTSAVARCVATRNVRKYLSFWWMFQPSSRGRITLWPRLETGKSSETPWRSPRTIARG